MTYKQRVAHRLKKAFEELKPLVVEAVKTINVFKANPQGNKPVMTLEQKVLALLLKHLFGRSNREMSFMLIIFSWLSDVSVSYKTIKKHNCTEAQKLKDKIKENTSKEKNKTVSVYSFVLMDLKSRMHIGIGTSFKSEKAAFMKALDMTKEALY